jgi:hypothetical protein
MDWTAQQLIFNYLKNTRERPSSLADTIRASLAFAGRIVRSELIACALAHERCWNGGIVTAGSTGTTAGRGAIQHTA